MKTKYIENQNLIYRSNNIAEKINQDSSLDFTVAILTYNGENRLPIILELLLAQFDTENISWEIVVIDNNSTDKTVEVIQGYQSEWNKPYPLRYYLEKKQGSVYARDRAIVEARGQLIGFLDDDNFPNPNWVAAAYSFAQSHPKAGVYGSKIKGKFEVEPPKNFQRIQGFLAIKEHGNKPFIYNPNTLNLPAGAGMVIRKQVWLEHVPKQLNLQDPVGKSLSGKGEDFEAMVHIGKSGWEVWYNPEMCISHQISGSRLERSYLIALVRSAGLNICTLRLINTKNWQKPIIIARIIIGNLRKLLWHIIKYKKQVKTDVVVACEMNFFLSSLLSPFSDLLQTLKTMD